MTSYGALNLHVLFTDEVEHLFLRLLSVRVEVEHLFLCLLSVRVFPFRVSTGSRSLPLFLHTCLVTHNAKCAPADQHSSSHVHSRPRFRSTSSDCQKGSVLWGRRAALPLSNSLLHGYDFHLCNAIITFIIPCVVLSLNNKASIDIHPPTQYILITCHM